MTINLNEKIGIGTVQFGMKYGISNHQGITPSSEVEKILDFASIHGINYIDTAYAYEHAEQNIGKFDLSRFRVISKYITQENLSIYEQLETSLKRLNSNTLYGYLAHRALDLSSNEKKSYNILREFKEAGVVKKIGVSFNTIDEVEYIIASNIDLDIIQVPYNYFDSRFEKYMKLFKQKGCEIHTRSTFLQGLFFCNINTLDPFFETIKPLLKQTQKVQNLSAQLLKFVLEKEFVDVVNIGVNNMDQLSENLKNIVETDITLPKLNIDIDSRIVTPSMWPK